MGLKSLVVMITPEGCLLRKESTFSWMCSYNRLAEEMIEIAKGISN